MIGGLANLVLAETVAGFSDPQGPAELLDPYRGRYFDGITRVWQSRSPGEAATVAKGLFPTIAPATVAAADALLADEDLPRGLRRIVVECRADTVLALACREVSSRAG